MKRIATALAMILLMGSVLQTMGQVLKGSKASSGAEPAVAQPAAAQPASPAPLTSRKAGGEPLAVASGGALTCTGADGTSACTDQQVYDLNQGILTGRRMHKSYLMNVKGVTQGSSGSLECTQDDGSVCTDEQVSAIISLASSTHSNDGEFHITRTLDKSDPIAMRKAGGGSNPSVMLAVRKAGGQPLAALKCTGADGASACTDQQVYDLNQGIMTGRRMHKPYLLTVKGVTQGSVKGSLVCTQNDGSACTDDQVAAIISLASTTNSRDGTIHIVREVDSASP
jgi:hypothetical protein